MSQNTEKQPLTASPDSDSSSSSSSRGTGMDCCLTHITAICRLFGMAVLAALWAATVTTLRGDYSLPTYVGYYLLGASLFVTFFEITWILDKMACCVRQGCCCRCWSVILWVDGWRKFVLYTALSVPLFLQGLKGAFQVICGFCLLVLACLYLIKSFSSLRSPTPPSPHPSKAQDLHTVTVVRHEIATQTDVTSPDTPRKKEVAKKEVTKPEVTKKEVTSVSAERNKTEPSSNPFDDEEEEDGEKGQEEEEKRKTKEEKH